MAQLGRAHVVRFCRNRLSSVSLFSTGSGRPSKNVELTSVRYPEVLKSKREFAKLTPEDVQHFRSILGSNHVLTEDIEGYNVDWLGTVRGQSECVLKPKTTAQVTPA